MEGTLSSSAGETWLVTLQLIDLNLCISVL